MKCECLYIAVLLVSIGQSPVIVRYVCMVHIPANTRHSPDTVLMLGQRRRRWPNIETVLVECLVFAGMEPVSTG